MDFRSIYAQGFARVAASTLAVTLADPRANAAAVIETARKCHDQAAAVALFPELCLSGYAIDDLLLQETLLDAVEAGVADIVAASEGLLPVIVVGAPLRWGNRLYNTAVAIHRGRILGVVPKMFLPNYREFYELRQCSPGRGTEGGVISVAGREAPFGPDLLFTAADVPRLTIHIEICEDVWVPAPPSTAAALAGATVLLNLSASNITIGKAADRALLCRSQSARCLAAYAYAAAGMGESTTDLAWDGQTGVFECGALLAETERFADGARFCLADVDLMRLSQERMRQNTFDENRQTLTGPDFREVTFMLSAPAGDVGLLREVERFPFVPADPAALDQDCYEAYNIQVSGLRQRLQAVGARKVVIGVSGGLDSTQALIVAAKAFDLMGYPRADILGFTMPGFATSDATKANAWALMRALGVTARELDIRPAARQMLGDLGHPFSAGEPVYDVTFENVQAGLRTDYLFRLANHHGAIVMGTGDLSELALGWCTYGVGDQMSHYNVNGGVPKTLIQHLIRWVGRSGGLGAGVEETLLSILDTEISPELVPAAPGEKPQSTQAIIGPYALQDFNLFYTLRYGFPPSRIAFLALHAWGEAGRGRWPSNMPEDARGAFDLPAIRRWLTVFVRRFFGFSQFKRSAAPNGPKVVHGGSLSPRGDWRAPSDGNARAWLDELNRNVPEA